MPSIGQYFACRSYGCGVAVHVNGSGFPAGVNLNCWFTRPDGTTYNGYPVVGKGVTTIHTDASGGFAGIVTLTYSSENGYQGEQLGQWAVTCGTPDGKYSGTAWFDVVGLLDP